MKTAEKPAELEDLDNFTKRLEAWATRLNAEYAAAEEERKALIREHLGDVDKRIDKFAHEIYVVNRLLGAARGLTTEELRREANARRLPDGQ